MYIGILLDGYIDGDFYIGDGEDVSADKLELAPFIKCIEEWGSFLNRKNTPLSNSSLTKQAQKTWDKREEVRHNIKHKNNPNDKKGRNKK